MKIIVCIKQVPESSRVRMDPDTGLMIREGMIAVVNPLDLYAVEAALRLKELYGGTVTALTMGPAAAMAALREVIAMGCDDALLLSDKQFAGGDTWATSRVLSAAIRTLLPDTDLILCGERAVDGDTGQVGPGIAAWLDLPVVTYVAKLAKEGNALIAERLIEEGRERLRMELPGVVTVVKEIHTPRLPTLDGKKKARVAVVPTITAERLGLAPAACGLAGSPTRVVRITQPKLARGGRIIRAATEAEIAAAVDAAYDWIVSVAPQSGRAAS